MAMKIKPPSEAEKLANNNLFLQAIEAAWNNTGLMDWAGFEATLRAILRSANTATLTDRSALLLIDETVGAFTHRGQQMAMHHKNCLCHGGNQR